MNPMEEFKQQQTKEVKLGDKLTILFKDLMAKDSAEIENRVAMVSVKDTMSEYQMRKIETLKRCIVSINNVLLKDFDNVKKDLSNSISEDIAIQNEIMSWNSIITDKIYNYYLQFLKERNEKIDKDINFQNSLS